MFQPQLWGVKVRENRLGELFGAVLYDSTGSSVLQQIGAAGNVGDDGGNR